MRYFITPLNENQPLNYSETISGSYIQAVKRADSLRVRLQAVLTQATITVEIIWFENGNQKKSITITE